MYAYKEREHKNFMNKISKKEKDKKNQIRKRKKRSKSCFFSLFLMFCRPPNPPPYLSRSLLHATSLPPLEPKTHSNRALPTTYSSKQRHPSSPQIQNLYQISSNFWKKIFTHPHSPTLEDSLCKENK